MSLKAFVAPFLLVAAGLCVSPAAFCGWNDRAQLKTDSIRLDYRLYVPEHLESRSGHVPLVVALHGGLENEVDFANLTGITELAEKEGFAVLFPIQSPLRNPMQFWNWFDRSNQERGRGELEAITQSISKTLSEHPEFDPSKVFVLGFSAGAAMTTALLSLHPELFAAGAIHSGVSFRAADNPFAAIEAMKHGSPFSADDSARAALAQSGSVRKAVSVLVLHGSADHIVSAVNADQVFEHFRVLHDLRFASSDGSRPNWEASGARRESPGQYPVEVSQLKMAGCANLLLSKEIVEGMGHSWGGASGSEFADPRLRIRLFESGSFFQLFSDIMGPVRSSYDWKFLFWAALGVFCATPWVSAPLALLAGAGVGLSVGNPRAPLSRKLTPKLLQLSVVGLGAGMDLRVVGRVGAHGVVYTIVGIALTLAAGMALARALGATGKTPLLISVGTAICGGSAIAAVGPVVRAKDHDMTVALATVFLLNAAALVLFPWIGHELHLSQREFGLWSALAIHDTSSVVGATMVYGREALEVGTTVKLARALWIVPVTLIFAWGYRDKGGHGTGARVKMPWFIVGFLVVAGLRTFIPELAPIAKVVEWVARRGLVVTLFLIGSNLSRQSLTAVGVVPFVQGLTLWFLVAAGSLAGIFWGWVRV